MDVSAKNLLQEVDIDNPEILNNYRFLCAAADKGNATRVYNLFSLGACVDIRDDLGKVTYQLFTCNYINFM